MLITLGHKKVLLLHKTFFTYSFLIPNRKGEVKINLSREQGKKKNSIDKAPLYLLIFKEILKGGVNSERYAKNKRITDSQIIIVFHSTRSLSNTIHR